MRTVNHSFLDQRFSRSFAAPNGGLRLPKRVSLVSEEKSLVPWESIHSSFREYRYISGFHCIKSNYPASSGIKSYEPPTEQEVERMTFQILFFMRSVDIELYNRRFVVGEVVYQILISSERSWVQISQSDDLSSLIT